METQKNSETSEIASNTSNSVVPFFNEEELHIDEPILIKTSFSQEVYHGNKLKSRIELSKCQEIPRHRDKRLKGPSSMPMEEMDNYYRRDQDEFRRAKLREQNIYASLNRDEDKQRSCCFMFMNIVLIIFIPVVIGYFVVSNSPIPVEKVEKELRVRLLNQEHSIDTVIDSLRQLEDGKQILTVLTGPTGVGKTHLVNILSEQISSWSITVFYNFNSNGAYNEESVMWKLSPIFSPFTRILVLEDLKISDIERLQKLIQKIFSFKRRDFLILAVFNLDSEGCLGSSPETNANPIFIKEKLKTLSKQFYFTHFNFLDESIARQRLQEEFRVLNVKTEYYDVVMDHLLQSHNMKCHGLKGLHSKLKVLLKL